MRRGAIVMSPEPVRGGHAPPVSRHEPREPIRGYRRTQIVADTALVRQELFRHYGADRVTALVFRAASAAPVPVEASDRVGAARFQRAAEHVAIAHPSSIRARASTRTVTPPGGSFPFG